VAVLSFALGDSDLPLQVAFPLLMSNLADALIPPSEGILPPSSALGEPIVVQVDPALESLSLVEVATGAQTGVPVIGGTVTIPGARQVGIRELWASGEAGEERLGRTAANLFDAGESRVAPGNPLRIADMGRVGPPVASDSLATRAEWWFPLALAALLLLLVEWILFHRPTRRALVRLLRRGGGTGGTAAGAARPARGERAG
jgi:hypothetical protein